MKKIYLFVVLFCALSVFSFTACNSKSQIEAAVAIANEDCPEDLGDGLVMTKIETSGNNIVYEFAYDESDAYVSELRDPDVMSVMKDVMLYALQVEGDSDTKELIRLCKDANYNIIIRYVGTYSGETVDVKIFAHEL